METPDNNKHPLVGHKFPVGNHGFVQLMDFMGSDEDICMAAWVSTEFGSLKKSPIPQFLDYLMRHGHCYHPGMQVLTVDGWKMWSECDDEETFLVPDPETRTLKPERLPVLRFPFTGELEMFQNKRMSYAVTANHRMFFRPKYQSEFSIYEAGSMPKWGHFDPLAGYTTITSDEASDLSWEFTGFYLGDGFIASPNRIQFHLKRPRKIAYLEELLAQLGITYQKAASSTREGAWRYTIPTPDFLRERVSFTAGAANKQLLLPVSALCSTATASLYKGLLNSDGSVRQERSGQMRYTSKSAALLKLFESLAVKLGYDAHSVCSLRESGVGVVAAYHPGRTSLEARKEYFGKVEHTGEVCCATTSTGLLAVRGADTEFGFVCGNSSPFEMCEVKFRISLPLAIQAQLATHRTASRNQASARYVELPDLNFFPNTWREGNTGHGNKQGSSGPIDQQDKATQIYNSLVAHSKSAEQELRALGVAPELARFTQLTSQYTTLIWKMDLRNLLGFLKQRTDNHAQEEMRDYANVIEYILKELFPHAMKAWENHHKNAVTFSQDEQAVLAELIQRALTYDTAGSTYPDAETEFLTETIRGSSLRKSRQTELLEKLNRVLGNSK